MEVTEIFCEQVLKHEITGQRIKESEVKKENSEQYTKLPHPRYYVKIKIDKQEYIGPIYGEPFLTYPEAVAYKECLEKGSAND